MSLRTFFIVIFISIRTITYCQFCSPSNTSVFDSKWVGNTDKFIVENCKIRSNFDEDKTDCYISRSIISTNEYTWNIKGKMFFNPSSQNYIKIYLLSSDSLLTSNPDGYYIQVGGTNDDISLYKTKNTKSNKLISSKDGILNNENPSFDITVTLKENNWSVLYSIITDSVYVDSITYNTDDNEISYGWNGLLFRYTKTRKESFLIDTFLISSNTKESNSPYVLNTTLTDSSVTVLFNQSVKKLDWFSDCNLTLSESSNRKYVWKFDTEVDKTPNSPYRLSLKSDVDTILYIVPLSEPQKGDVVLNEILIDPTTDGAEFVEIYNISKKYIDITSLSIATRKTNLNLYGTTTIGTVQHVLFPNTYCVVSKDIYKVCSVSECADNALYITASIPVLNNNSGHIVLLDKKENIIDELTYISDSIHSELVNETKGLSLERINPMSDKWSTCSTLYIGGSPGVQNTIYSEFADASNINFEIKVKAITSDSPEIIIEYEIDNPSSNLTVNIYDTYGKKVRDLISAQIMKSKGEIKWDGKDNNGHKMTIAPYVVRIEYTDTNGKSERKRIVCAIGE